MRALPLIERVLLILCAVVVVAVLGFLIAWHVRFVHLVAYEAATTLRPGAPSLPAQPAAPDPALATALVACTRGNEALTQRAADLLHEQDSLRMMVSATTPAAAPDATAAAVAGLIARGMRLDGAPVPDWNAPEAVYQQWAQVFAHLPALDIAVHDLEETWLRRVARPAEWSAALGDFDAAVAAMDQPSNDAAYLRWSRMQDVRDAAYVVAALIAGPGGAGPGASPGAWRARDAGWLAEPASSMAMAIASRESFRIRVRPMYSIRMFSTFPLDAFHGKTGGIRESLGTIERWWDGPMEATQDPWATWTDDLIARRKTSIDDVWKWWKMGTQMVPGEGARGIRADARHRLALLAVRMLDARGADGAFPAPAAIGITAADLTAHGDMPPLIIHADGRRLLIAIDRRVTLPSYLTDCFALPLSSTAEDGALPFSLTPEAVSIDVGDSQLRALIAGAGAATPAATAP